MDGEAVCEGSVTMTASRTYINGNELCRSMGMAYGHSGI
jgi:hypothetical protein